jgi:hypothetical protein
MASMQERKDLPAVVESADEKTSPNSWQFNYSPVSCGLQPESISLQGLQDNRGLSVWRPFCFRHRQLAHYKMCTPVQLPTFLIGLLTEGPFFTVGNRIDPADAYSLRNEKILGGIRASITQREIVPFRSPFVCVALDCDPNI